LPGDAHGLLHDLKSDIVRSANFVHRCGVIRR
jgi:hypothetical protein